MAPPQREHRPERAPEEWRRAFAWIERELGGSVVRAERQPRWRPAWLLNLERDGETLPLYFRGARVEVDDGAAALGYEMRIFEVLAAHDIPVPRIYGLCPDPSGIVMERCAGRANLASARDDAEREAVVDHYIEILARVHRIDVAAFEAVGLHRPKDSEELALADFDSWEQRYRAAKQRPEPAIEFLVRWVRRNLPRASRPVAFICADSGQFLFEAGRVTTLLDLEIACLGDPVADLGGLRSRDLSEPLGDLSRAIRCYEAQSGEAVDREVLDFHTVRFALVTPLAVAGLVAAEPPGIDLVQYLGWYLVWTRSALEVVANRLGVELAPSNASVDTRSSDAPARSESDGGGFARYRESAAARLATYRERQQAMGPGLDAEDLDDVSRFLGRGFTSCADADRVLEEWVLAAGPEREVECVALLHRRILRREAILEPVMQELAGARMQRIR